MICVTLRYIYIPLSFATLVLLYNSTGSKTAVKLFCHTLPSGSYPFMQSWLSRLEPHKKREYRIAEKFVWNSFVF